MGSIRSFSAATGAVSFGAEIYEAIPFRLASGVGWFTFDYVKPDNASGQYAP